MSNLSILDIVNLSVGFVSLIVGIVSLILGWIAVRISLHFKAEADKVNQDTINQLIEIKTDAKVISDFLKAEVSETGKMSRGVITTVLGTLNRETNVSMNVPNEPIEVKTAKE